VKNKGCSIALIITSVFLLVTVVTFYFYFYPRLERLASSTICYAVEKRIHDYYDAFGEWPSGDNTSILLQLRGDNPDNRIILKEEDGFLIDGNQLVDQWGHPLIINFTDDGPHVLSPGKSGIHGTDDDVDRSIFLKMQGENSESSEKPPQTDTSLTPISNHPTCQLTCHYPTPLARPSQHANLS